MTNCRRCDKAFIEAKPWQVFCCERCQQDWHLLQRKLARQDRLFERLKERDQGVNGHGTVEEQREKAREVMARFIAEVGNGNGGKSRFVRRI